MSCKLKIHDPILSFFLRRDSFESYEDFKNQFENSLIEGVFPLSDKLVPIYKGEKGYEIEGQNPNNVDSIVQLALSNLLETNSPDLQFHRLLDTYNLYLNKYEQDYLKNETKEQDLDFLESLVGFYENFPVTQEFKETEIYQNYLIRTQEIQSLLGEIDEDLRVSDEIPTNESELWNPREEPYYVYTLTKLYKKSDKDIHESEDPLSVLRFKTIQHLETLKNREFFIRLEPDTKENVQTAIPEDSWRWGVVAVLYERVDNEFKRVYVKNNKGEITTNPKEGKEWGANKSKNFTFTIPRFENKEAYGKINSDARQALIAAREQAEKEPSSYYPITGFNHEFPKGTPITLDKFIQDTKVRLSIATDKDRIFYPGNLYVQFPNGEKAPTTRLPLNEQWRKLVFGLINFEHKPEDVEQVVSFLNNLLSYKGGDIHFFNRKGKIITYRYSKKVQGKFQRVSEETPKNEIPELLEYARINVSKPFLEGTTQIPYIKDKELKFKIFNPQDWEQFYKEHHSTIARQIEVEGKNWFGPIPSIMFNVESAESQHVTEQIPQIRNPKIGNIEIEPDQEFNLSSILEDTESISNQITNPQVKEIWQIFGLLYPNIKDNIKDKKIVFSTKENKNFKGTYFNGTIIINYNLIPDVEFINEVLAHEIIHALTADWLEQNPDHELTQRLEGLLKLVPDSIPDYRSKNIYELLADLSNPEVAEQLKKVKIKDKSLLEKITEVVKEILGKVFGIESLKKEDKNLYEELVTKLVTIATQELKQEPISETKSSSGLRKRAVRNLPLGYDQESLDAFQERLRQEKEDKTFLNNLVDSIDVDIAQFIHNKGLLSDFIAGRLPLEAVFEHLNDEYFEEDNLTLNKTQEQKRFFSAFTDENFDFVKEYWIENTSFAKIKEGQIEPIDVNEPNDPTEILDNEQEEKEAEQSAISGGEEVNEGRDYTERTGMNTSSLEAADKLSRVFVKIIPAIEKDKNGTTKIYTREEVTDEETYYKFIDSNGKVVSTDPKEFTQTPYGFIRFERNQLGRFRLNDYTNTWNRIADVLANNLSLEEMFQKIDSTPELIDVVPEIFVLKERLNQPIKNTFQAEVRTKVETSFKRAKVGIWIVLKKGGNFHVINESKDFGPSAKRQVNTLFLNNLTGELSSFYDRESGEFRIREFLKTFQFEKNGELQINRIEKDMEILPLLGFDFHPKTIKSEEFITNEYREFKVNLIKFLSNFETIPISIAEFVTKDQQEGNKKIAGLNNFFKRVYELENKNNPIVVSAMVRNAENENQSSLSLFNSLLQNKLHYNRSQTETELEELIPRTKNPLYKYSLTRKLLFKDGQRTERQLEIENLNGLKTEQEGTASKGALLIDLSEEDWILTNFVFMLKQGLIENTRAETASTTYAFRMNDWGLNFADKRKTPFTIGEVQSIFDKERISLTLESPIFNQWLDYLRGEIERSAFNGKPFGLFSDIFDKNEQEKLIGEGIEPNIQLIQTNLNKWFNDQYKEYDQLFNKSGGYSALINPLEKQSVEGKYDRELDNLIYPNKNNLEDEYKAFFVINSLIIHTEEIILFQGDISESPKYFKRAKGVQSTGNPLSKSKELTSFLQEELIQSSFAQAISMVPLSVGTTYRSVTLTDDTKVSHYYKSGQFQKGYLESKKAYNIATGIEYNEKDLKEELSLLEPYKEVNIGDGAAFANPDFYFYMLSKVGSINQDQILGFKALALDFRKNVNRYLPKELASQVNTNLTEQEEKIRKEGLRLIEEGKVIFPVLKFTYRGNGTNEEVRAVQAEIMDKFAITPLFPQFTSNKPVASELFLKMIQGGYGYVKFESGTKIGKFGTTDFIQEIEKGNLEVSLDNSSHNLQEEYLREQIKTPDKIKKENTFGSQFRKLIISALKRVDGEFLKLDNEENAGDLVKKWEKLNQEFSKLTEIEVLSEFGIQKTELGWDYSSIDLVKAVDVLLRESRRRDLPENLKIYFDKYKRGKLQGEELANFYKYFETSLGSQQVQNLIASIIKKISIQKLQGAQLIQSASSIFDRTITVEGKTRELGFYHLKDSEKAGITKLENGNLLVTAYRTNESDITSKGEYQRGKGLYLSLDKPYPGKNKYLVQFEISPDNLLDRRKNSLGTISEDFFILEKNKRKDKNLDTLHQFKLDMGIKVEIGSINGLENDNEVVIFDKQLIEQSLSTMTPLSKVQAAECKVSMMGDFKNLLKLERVTTLLELENLEDNELNRTQMLNRFLTQDSFVEEFKDQLTIIGYRIPTQGFNSMEVMVIREFLPSFYGPTIICPPEITAQSGTDYDYDKLSVILPLIDKDGTLSNKGKKGIQNQMIRASKDILLDKVNYHRLITPNTNKLVFDSLDEIFEPLEISTKDILGTQIITTKTNLRKFKAVKGKGLLGVAAVWNTFYTLMQRHNWTLNPVYQKEIGFGNKKSYVEMGVNPVLNPNKDPIYHPFTKDRISKLEIISQLINVTVDMPSDDKFGYTIFDKSDMGAFIYSMAALGYSLKNSLYFFHQPIIYQYKKLTEDKIRQGFKPYQAKYFTIYELLKKDFPRKKGGDYDFNKAEKELYSDILPTNEKELNPDKIYSLTPVDKVFDVKIDQQQMAILSHYLLLLDQAEQIRTIQSSINFDTSPDNNIQKSFRRKENYEKGIKSGIISKSKIDEVYSDSVISGLYSSPILEVVTSELFPVLYSEENQLMFTDLSNEYKDTENAFRIVSNDFLLSVVQNYGEHNGKNIFETAQEFLQGDKKLDLIQQAEQIQKNLNKEGLNFRLLDILVVNISKKRKDKVFNQQILLGFENSSEDKNKITEEFRQLLKRPDTKEFAENLALVGLVQSGWLKSPVYFSDLIPEEFVTPIVSEALDKFESLNKAAKEKFRANFIRKFQWYRANELGVKDRPWEDTYYPRESYRFANYKNLVIQYEETDFNEEIINYINSLIPNYISSAEDVVRVKIELASMRMLSPVLSSNEELLKFSVNAEQIIKNMTSKELREEDTSILDNMVANAIIEKYAKEGLSELEIYQKLFKGEVIPGEEEFTPYEEVTNTELIGNIAMQPDNIAMIKSGRKTQTIRTDGLKDGIYKMPDGTLIELRNIYGGTIKAKDIGNRDQFAYNEGFKDWTDFENNNKFSKNFIEQNALRYVYSVRLINQSVLGLPSGQEQQIRFEEEPSTGYRERTIKNASADATIAIAVDFDSAGEKLTKKSVLEQNKLYISIDANNLTVTKERVDKIVNALNEKNIKTLNIAGNGIYTMKGKYTQQQVDDFTFDLLNQVINSPNLKAKIVSIRSGGQTGFDEAGAKAGLKLGLPTLVLAPKGWKFRNKEGQDISNESQFKARFEIQGQPITPTGQQSLFGYDEESKICINF